MGDCDNTRMPGRCTSAPCLAFLAAVLATSACSRFGYEDPSLSTEGGVAGPLDGSAQAGDARLDGGPAQDGPAARDADGSADRDAGGKPDHDAGGQPDHDATVDSPPVPGCVTWDPLKKGTGVTLSNGQLDATSNATAIAVATHGLTDQTGQRAYLEVVVLRADNNAEVAIMDGNVSYLDDYHDDIAGSSVWYDNFYDELRTKGAGWTLQVPSAAPNFSSGDVIMWALDRSQGNIWYGRNGTWIAGGDPASAQAPTFKATTTDDWYPSVCVKDDAQFRILTTATDFTHPIPATFPSFASAVGLGDSSCVP
jgi:hypothetical protein